MISAIKEVYNIIKTLFDFIIGFIHDLIELVKMVGEAVAKVPSMLGFLPSAILSLLLLLIGVAVMYKVLGREG